MAFQTPGYKLPAHAAGADLRTHQFKAVIISTSTVNQVTLPAGGEKIAGVLQNKPNTNQAAEVVVDGVSKAIAGAAIAQGAEVEVDSAGKVITLAAGVSVGIALIAASADGDIISVLLK